MALDGSTVTMNKRESSSFQQAGDGDSRHCESLNYSIPRLPEDIWFHIHSLMPICDAARAACLSRAFLRSWRCRPNLTFNYRTFYRQPVKYNFSWEMIDKIIRNHSGTGLKTFELNLYHDRRKFPYVDSWLQAAVRPGIEVLILRLHKKYNFPCSLLSDGVRNSIQDLTLDSCVFHPTSELGPLRKLTSLDLTSVHIRGDELECLLSHSLALEQLVLFSCNKIISLKIPYVLQQLSRLTVIDCSRLKVIECKAPNISIIEFSGGPITISLRQLLQMKKLSMSCADAFCYTRAELPSIMPNLESLEICAGAKVVKTPMLITKFLYLKHLDIDILGRTPSFDYFSLVSFFDESPSLETFFLHVPFDDVKHESSFGDSSHLRQLPEHRHNCLKIVDITGFSSAKSLVELTCCIVKNAVALEFITLNTLDRRDTCSGGDIKSCWPIRDVVLKEAYSAVAVIRMYIEDKVAPTAKLTVLGPCARCH